MRLVDQGSLVCLFCVALLELGRAAEARLYSNATGNATLSNATTSQATTTSRTADSGLGGFILQGLGASSQSSSIASTTATLNATNSTNDAGSVASILASLRSAFPTTLFTEDCCTYTTKPTLTAASTGSGFSYASECNYEQQVHPFLADDPWSTSVYQTYTTTTKFKASITTLCDGVPRVVGTLTPTASSSSKINGTSSLSYTGPWPTCNIGPSDCVQLKSTWSSVDSAWAALTSAYTTYLTLAPSATALTYGNNITGYSTTYFTGIDGSLPVITIGGTAYTANSSTYSIPSSLTGDLTGSMSPATYSQTLMPGESSSILPNEEWWAGHWVKPTCATTTQSSSTTSAANSTITSGAAYDGSCTIMGGNVRLMYFPVPQNVSRDMCTTGPTTTGTTCPYGKTTASDECEGGCGPCPYYPFNITSTTDSGAYAMVNGSTFYANRAYISLETAYAINSAGNRVGGDYAGTIITLPSSDIYSLQTTDDHGLAVNVATRFNFADLNSLVPAAAYRGAMWCIMYGPPSPAVLDAFGGSEWILKNETYGGKNSSFGAEFDWGYEFYAWVNDQPTDECNIIVDNAYAPVLAVPPQMYSIDPLWSSCGLDLQGLYDPPTALTAVATEATVTKPTTMQTTTAEPSSAVSSAAPQTSMGFTYATTSSEDPAPASTQTQVLQPTSSVDHHSSAQQQSSTSNDPNAGSGSAATDPAFSVSTSIQHTTVIIVSSSSLVDPTNGQGQASEPVGSAVSSQNPAVPSTAGDPTTQAQSQVQGSSTSDQSPASPAQATTLAFSDSQASSQGGSTANAAGPGQSNTQAAEGEQGSTQDPQASGAAPSTSVFFTYAGPTETAVQSASDPALVGTTIVIGSGANPANPGAGASSASQQSAPVTVTYEAGGQALTATQVASTSNILNIGGQTISAGGAPATIGSNTISLGSGGSLVVNGGQATQASQANVQASASTLTYAVGSDTFTAVQASSAPNALSIGGQTITAGGAPVTVDGNTISVGSTGGLVVNGGQATQASQTDVQASASAVTYAVGSNTFTAVHASSASNLYSIGGTTLSEGGSPVTVQGTTYSAGSSGLVINGQGATAITSQTSGGGSGASLTIVGIGGSSGAIAVNGATLYDGGSATVIAGVTLSAGTSGLVVDQTRTVPVAMASQSQAGGTAAAVTIGSQVYTAAASGSGNGLVIGSQTMSAGGPAVTIGGHTFSEGASGLVIDGTRTVTLSASPAAQTSKPEAVLALGSETLTAAEIASGSITDIIIGSHTLSPGSETTINGIDISAGRSGLIIGGTKTVGLSSQPLASASAHLITLNGHTLTVQYPATAGGDAVVDGVTMTAGEQTTVDGFVVSEGTSGVAFSALTINRSVNGNATATSSSSSSQSQLPSVLITTSSPATPTASVSRPSASAKTKSDARRVGVSLQSAVTCTLMSVVIVMLM